MMFEVKTRGPWFAFGLTTLLILLPLLLTGYVQTLDMTWGPQINVPEFSNNTWLFYTLLKVAAMAIGSQAVEKVMLLSIFVIAAMGAFRLASQRPINGRAGAYMAGLVYVLNPFIYTRFVEGQYLVLLGYALLPWAVAAIWRLVTAPSWRHASRVMAWCLAVAAVSLHTIGFVLLIGVIMVAVGWRHSRRMWTWLGIGVALTMAALTIWLGPLVLGHSAAARAIGTFDAGQYKAFATVNDVGGVPLSSALLEGFWNDHSHTYILPSSGGAWWLVVMGLIGVIIVIGAAHIYWRRDKLGYALIVSGVIAWWLAMGVGWNVSAPLTNWLVAHLPFYRGYREPGKWLAVVALGYAYLSARGISQVEAWLSNRERLKEWKIGAILVLPFLAGSLIFWGAHGQLHSRDYPADWYAADARISANHTDFKVLILPWHLYLPIRFVGRPVANPAGVFFSKPVIVSHDPELTGVAAEGDGPDAQILAWLRGNITTQAALSPLKVQYIVLLKEADWRTYPWLSNDPKLNLISNTTNLQVYQLAGKPQ